MASQPSQSFYMGMPYSHDQLHPIYEVPGNSFFSNLLHKEMDNNQGVNGKNVGDSVINPLFKFDKKGKYALDQKLNPSLGGEDRNFDKARDPGSTPAAVIIPSFELESWYNQLQDKVIIGICHGSRPSLKSLRVWMNQNWSNRNIRVNHVQYLPNGYYLFLYENPNFALQIVSQGQWILTNTPISMFNWYLGFNPKGPKPTKSPVWVDFVDLHVELYPLLKHIGSYVGRVLGQRYRGGINPKFDPQLLIELDLSKELIHFVPIQDSNGKELHSQKVVYKTLPKTCFHCMKMWHFIKDFPDLKPQTFLAEASTEKKDDFQNVAKKFVPKNNKGNKASSSKNRNRFSPLLEDVFDPLVCTTLFCILNM
ncbi:hypothetical protein L7F22_002171 [Adiantum nelumboides]|nr:hypothetical protein [Adiantum nelumboides]